MSLDIFVHMKKKIHPVFENLWYRKSPRRWKMSITLLKLIKKL